jgi:hypothetical protein
VLGLLIPYTAFGVFLAQSGFDLVQLGDRLVALIAAARPVCLAGRGSHLACGLAGRRRGDGSGRTGELAARSRVFDTGQGRKTDA